MIHTNLPRNCMVFLIPLQTNMVGHRRGKKKTVQFRDMFVWIIVFYFYNIFLPMHFITNGYK